MPRKFNSNISKALQAAQHEEQRLANSNKVARKENPVNRERKRNLSEAQEGPVFNEQKKTCGEEEYFLEITINDSEKLE